MPRAAAGRIARLSNAGSHESRPPGVLASNVRAFRRDAEATTCEPRRCRVIVRLRSPHVNPAPFGPLIGVGTQPFASPRLFDLTARSVDASFRRRCLPARTRTRCFPVEWQPKPSALPPSSSGS